MKYILSLLFCITAIDGNSQAPQSYTGFYGDVFNLYKWEGRKMVFLTQTDALDAAVMSRWIGKVDDAYDYYESATGREPHKWHLTYLNDRSTLAIVNTTCGAGCGYLGSTGIEIMQLYFPELYNSAAIDEYNHIPFYELGRNFWFYENKLNYKEISNVYDPNATGFAVIMRFKSMEHGGLVGAPFDGMPFEDFKASVKNILNTYLNDPTLTWHNTLAINEGIPSYRGAPDLFASFCFYLADNYGNHNWIQNVWKYAGLRPDAVTTQDAVDNFIIASSQAANQNLTALFQSWRWPISSQAIEELNNIFSVLPITLTLFSFEKNCDDIKFIWTTASENNASRFELEKSTDGIAFEKTGFVAATNTNLPQQYSYVHTTSDITAFYRLKLLDIDGTFSYSEVLKVSGGCRNNIKIFPNPVNTEINIRGNVNSNLQLINTNGVVLQQWPTQDKIDISGYPAGIYYLRIGQQVYKLFKQ